MCIKIMFSRGAGQAKVSIVHIGRDDSCGSSDFNESSSIFITLL